MIATENQWSSIKKTGIVFLITFLWIKMFPFPLGEIPGVKDIINYLATPSDFLTEWIGKNLLSLENFRKPVYSGSGDTTFDYVKLLFHVLFSIIVALIVSFIKIKQETLHKIYQWVFTYARYYVALYLMVYGAFKFLEGQFSPPGFMTLEQTFGESTPMGLLWTFMGASIGYTYFVGFCELLACYLLLFRKTTPLGSLVSIAVMLNVVLLNFCYDVPVKLFSSELLFISIVIAYPNLKNITNFFLNNTPVALKREVFLLPKKWMRMSRVALKSIIIIGFPIVIFAIFQSESGGVTLDDNSKKLAGYYVNNNVSIHAPWKHIIIDESYASIKKDSTVNYYNFSVDIQKKTIRFESYRDSTDTYQFNYKNIDSKTVKMSSVKKSDSLNFIFNKKTKDDYLLTKTGFNWINEIPNNQ